MPKFTVTDTITFERTWRNVEAPDEDAAIDLIASGDHEYEPAEAQIDAEPYEAVRVFPFPKGYCDLGSRGHWNGGDDICEMCGADLHALAE